MTKKILTLASALLIFLFITFRVYFDITQVDRSLAVAANPPATCNVNLLNVDVPNDFMSPQLDIDACRLSTGVDKLPQLVLMPCGQDFHHLVEQVW